MWKSGGYFSLFFSIFYYKIGKSDKYEYHRKKFIPRYVVHTTTSPRVSKGVKSSIRSLLLRLKGSNRHRLVLLPLYAAFSLYCNVRNLSISKSRASGATAFTCLYRREILRSARGWPRRGASLKFKKAVLPPSLLWMGGIKKTFAKTIAFCLNLCYNIHRKRAPMSVAPLISWFKK